MLITGLDVGKKRISSFDLLRERNAVGNRKQGKRLSSESLIVLLLKNNRGSRRGIDDFGWVHTIVGGWLEIYWFIGTSHAHGPHPHCAQYDSYKDQYQKITSKSGQSFSEWKPRRSLPSVPSGASCRRSFSFVPSTMATRRSFSSITIQ